MSAKQIFPTELNGVQFGSVGALKSQGSKKLKSAVVTLLAGSAMHAYSFVPDLTDTTSAGDDINIVVSTVDGTRFKRVHIGDKYKVLGLVDDGDTTATDNQATLQSSFNYAIYFLKGMEICIPDGTYAYYDTLHAGYGADYGGGNKYVHLHISGCGYQSLAGHQQGTTLLYKGPKDRPAINIQGATQSTLENFHLQNDRNYVNIAGLQYTPESVASAWNPATWTDPTWPASATSATAPFAGITIDAYTDAVPTTAYPNVTFPGGIFTTAFYSLGSAALNDPAKQYQKQPSTLTTLQYLRIDGFYIGVAVAPGMHTTQSDFVTYNRVYISCTTYCIAVGGSNPRENSVVNSFLTSSFAAVATGVVGSEGGGPWMGAIINTGLDRTMYWAIFNNVQAQYGRPLQFINCYAEDGWALFKYGTRTGPGQTILDQNVALQYCRCGFIHTGARGVPPRLIEMSLYSSVAIHGGIYDGYHGVFSVECDPRRSCATDGVVFSLDADPTKLYEKIANNGSGGGLVFNNHGQTGFGDYHVKYKGWNSSGSSVAPTLGMTRMATSAQQPGSWYARDFTPAKPGVAVPNPRCGYNGGVSFSSMVKRTNSLDWDFVWTTARTQDYLAWRGFGVGDILIDYNSGTCWKIFASSTTGFSARQQNNYYPSGSDYLPINAITTPLTACTTLVTRMFTPNVFTKGVCTTGSNTVTATDASGSNANVATVLPAASALPAGCKAIALFYDTNFDNTFNPGSNDVAVITDTTGGVLTLTKLSTLGSSNAAANCTETVTRQITMAALIINDDTSG